MLQLRSFKRFLRFKGNIKLKCTNKWLIMAMQVTVSMRMMIVMATIGNTDDDDDEDAGCVRD